MRFVSNTPIECDLEIKKEVADYKKPFLHRSRILPSLGHWRGISDPELLPL